MTKYVSKQPTSVLAEYGAFRRRAIAIAMGGRYAGWRPVMEKLRSEGYAEAESFLSAPNFRTEIDRLCGGGSAIAPGQ